MAFILGKSKLAVAACAAVIIAAGVPGVSFASPLGGAVGAGGIRAVDLVEDVQYRPRRVAPVRAGVARGNRAGRNAAVAAAVGIGVLGIAAAAAAASQPRRGGVYYTEPAYAVDAWGRPVHGGYGRPVQYYDPRYAQPGYGYYQQEHYGAPRLSRWQKEQIKAQERARRAAVKQQVRQQQWYAQQQYQQQYYGRPQRGYGGQGWINERGQRVWVPNAQPAPQREPQIAN